jgi:hypothetical protein
MHLIYSNFKNILDINIIIIEVIEFFLKKILDKVNRVSLITQENIRY